MREIYPNLKTKAFPRGVGSIKKIKIQILMEVENF
jgi:hypothetical protein